MDEKEGLKDMLHGWKIYDLIIFKHGRNCTEGVKFAAGSGPRNWAGDLFLGRLEGNATHIYTVDRAVDPLIAFFFSYYLYYVHGKNSS